MAPMKRVPKPNHDVVGVVMEGDVVRPFVPGDVLEPHHLGVETPVGEEAQDSRDLDGIVQPHVLHVGLAEEDQRRPLFRVEKPFHGGESRGLFLSNIHRLHVAGGEGHKQGWPGGPPVPQGAGRSSRIRRDPGPSLRRRPAAPEEGSMSPMAAMTKAPVTTAPIMVWRYCQRSQGFSIRDQKLVRASVPSGWISYPTGFCMNALVATMKNPEIHDPANTAKAENQCILGLSFLWPKRKRPRKEDSRKKAKVPSMARVWPMTPPVASENRAQFVPN